MNCMVVFDSLASIRLPWAHWFLRRCHPNQRPSTADATLGHGRASMASFGNWLKMQLQDGSTASGSMACRSTSDSILEVRKW